MKRGLRVVLLGMVIGCALGSYAAEVEQPQAIATLDLSLLVRGGPVTGEWMKNISFLSDSLIAAGLCRFEDSSKNPHVYIPIKKTVP